MDCHSLWPVVAEVEGLAEEVSASSGRERHAEGQGGGGEGNAQVEEQMYCDASRKIQLQVATSSRSSWDGANGS